MIKFESTEIIEGITVHSDADSFNTFYLLPNAPTFRIDERGNLGFKLLKYKLPIKHPSGKVGGGFLMFTTELIVPPAKEKIIREKLQARVNLEAQKRRIAPAPVVSIADIPYTKGEVVVQILSNSKTIVQSIYNSGTPSMFGNNVVSCMAELTPEGATIVEQAVQGKGLSGILVEYKLWHTAQMPPFTVYARFDARNFYQFVQEIHVDKNLCSADNYSETLNEITAKSKSIVIEVDTRGNKIDPKLVAEVKSWAMQEVKSAAEDHMKQALHLENPEDAKKWYTEQGIENVRRNVIKQQISSFQFDYKENQYYDRLTSPNDILPTITSLVDKNGKPYKWEDYFQEIDANDPFFQQINVSAAVNAPFDELPIHSIELKLTYDGKPMSVMGSAVDGEFRFTSPNEVARFASFRAKDKDKYKYSYQVNYKGSSKVFKSPEIETDSADSQLTVNIDDTGILVVDILRGDINFEEIQQVQIVFRYEDKANGVSLIERQFIMDKSNPVHSLKQVIFAVRDQPYKYKCKFFMKNNKEYVEDWKEGNSNKLYINDPFQGERTVRVIGISDFSTDVTSVIVDFKYQDKAHNYEQNASVVLNERQPFFDWIFPVIDQSSEVGVVSYSGTIINKNGTVKQIPLTVDNAPSIMVGDKNPDILKVQVFADLIDFDSTVKMVQLSLKYKDDKNSILQKKTLVFGKDKLMEQSWSVKLVDKAKIDFEWAATYFMLDGSKVTTKPTPSEEEVLMLETPDAVMQQIMPRTVSMAEKRALVKRRAAKRLALVQAV
jgi:hypothetical protein